MKAADDITFYIREGEALGLVGESGCGKTTTGRCIVRAIDPASGEVMLKARDGERVNMREVDKAELKRLRQEIQMIFQDPYSSLNPRMRLLQIVGEPLVVHRAAKGRELEDRVAVMHVRKLAESAETKELYMNPQHPYTEALMSAVPEPDARLRTGRIVLAGEVADPANPPSGCYFHPQCRYAQEVCEVQGSELREISEEHFVSCHLAEELRLEPVA